MESLATNEIGLAVIVDVHKKRAEPVVAVGLLTPSFSLTSVKVPSPLLWKR